MNNIFKTLFGYSPDEKKRHFKISLVANNTSSQDNKKTYLKSDFDYNLNLFKNKYNSLLSSDINIREFKFNIKNKIFKAAIFFIDGINDSNSINEFILKPLLRKTKETNLNKNSKTLELLKYNNISKRKYKLNIKKFDLKNYLYNLIIPHSNIKLDNELNTLISHINKGFTLLLVETLDHAFIIETKSNNFRSIQEPMTEPIIKSSHQGFIEDIRTNTSMIRRIINNENLVLENISVGNITKTDITICYMENITNESLISEVKFRLNNINIDSILYLNDIESLIIDNPISIFPQISSTERPDKAAFNILNGKIVLLINGLPYALIIPTIFIDFLSASEDNNLNFIFANFLKIIRYISFFIALFLPGFYIAITTFHQELIPSELLFAITTSRKSIPFPIILEILIMEFSFELLQEASIRVSSSFSTTIGIIGALILGDAAVSAHIVSPILIIIVAFTGISSFSIPDYSLKYSVRILRFLFIILGYFSGFLGIGFASFLLFCYMSNLSSFGIDYFSPYIPDKKDSSNNIFTKPIWMKNKRDKFLNTKKPNLEKENSMNWRNY